MGDIAAAQQHTFGLMSPRRLGSTEYSHSHVPLRIPETPTATQDRHFEGDCRRFDLLGSSKRPSVAVPRFYTDRRQDPTSYNPVDSKGKGLPDEGNANES